MILVDVADIAKNGLNVTNGAALVLDVAAVIIPGIPAVGGLAIKAAKAANAVDNAIDAAKLVHKVDNVVDASKATNKLGDAANIVGDFCSFGADTEVSTTEGTKEIAAIEVGDFVLAWNETDATLGYYEVTDTFSHADEVLTYLIVDGEWIETTPEHPFYVEGKGWVNAEDLRIGDKIRQADGTTGRVWLKWNVYKNQEMYNLTVDTAHTYFVGEGQWLVHNACKKPNFDTLKPGPYADESIPARGPDRAWTKTELEEIDRIGSTYGCHTCGTTNPGAPHFVPDHQPPSALNFGGDPQRLYPHCLACSRRQGGQVLQFLRRLMDLE